VVFDHCELSDLGEVINHHQDPGLARGLTRCGGGQAGRDHLRKEERSSRVHQDVLEGPIQVEGVRVSGRCCYVSVQLAVVAGLAEAVAVLMETRPSK
jgi:hypothetical protein